jgi:diguanylate cyclase (GGDEF)-like protein
MKPLKLSIRLQIFVLHLLLVLLLISGLSYRHYQNTLAQFSESLTAFHSAAALGLVSQLALAIAGGNYANVQLPEFLRELERNPKLLHFYVEGTTDYAQTAFAVRYDRQAGRVWRTTFAEDYQATLQARISSLSQKVEEAGADRVKMLFLLERAQAAIEEYAEHQALERQFGAVYAQPLQQHAPYIDYQRQQLLLDLPSNNQQGGSIKMVFDFSELSTMRARLLRDVLMESLWALLLASLLLGLLASRITSPINALSRYMRQDFSSLDAKSVPQCVRQDEIGDLARSFAKLLGQMHLYVQRLELLSKNDPLTGLLNRRAFEEIFVNFLEQTKPHIMALCYIDIDRFKKYNDTYGHNAGDMALQQVAKAIEGALERPCDHAFRLGGEEFSVMLSVEHPEEARHIAERIRFSVEALAIEHKMSPPLYVVTVSIGVCLNTREDAASQPLTLKMLTARADAALYRAKAAGRNRVEFAD